MENIISKLEIIAGFNFTDWKNHDFKDKGIFEYEDGITTHDYEIKINKSETTFFDTLLIKKNIRNNKLSFYFSVKDSTLYDEDLLKTYNKLANIYGKKHKEVIEYNEMHQFRGDNMPFVSLKRDNNLSFLRIFEI